MATLIVAQCDCHSFVSEIEAKRASEAANLKESVRWRCLLIRIGVARAQNLQRYTAHEYSRDGEPASSKRVTHGK